MYNSRVIKIEAAEHAFDSLAHQNLDCHHAIFELVDNAIAASKPNQKALIQIFLLPSADADKFKIVVADWGVGMDFDALQNCLQLGYQSISGSRLNEHGFGAKNALVTLSGGNGPWKLASRKNENEPYCVVEGPFHLEMPTHDEYALDFLPAGMDFAYPDPSTVVCVDVSRSFARTMTRRINSTSLPVLKNWLLEHLGVTYRGFLSQDSITMEPRAKIMITLEEGSVFVPPISVPMNTIGQPKSITVNLAGKPTKIYYQWGLLDEEKRDHLVSTPEGPMKAKFYYQGNIPTQGIDIVLGGRVIATAMLTEIWTNGSDEPLARHNEFNSFVGELIIPEVGRGTLTTLNNKTGIDPADKDWAMIFERLQDYKPSPKGKANTEAKLCESWTKTLCAARPEDTVTTERAVWPTATRIDVLDTGPHGKVDIYELKIGKAEPLGIYQLKMYWDGLVISGVQPTSATLLVKDYCSDMVEMVKLMNTMPPPLLPDGKSSLPYNFMLATHAEKKLNE